MTTSASTAVESKIEYGGQGKGSFHLFLLTICGAQSRHQRPHYTRWSLPSPDANGVIHTSPGRDPP
jgi:hypothetical protein